MTLNFLNVVGFLLLSLLPLQAYGDACSDTHGRGYHNGVVFNNQSYGPATASHRDMLLACPAAIARARGPVAEAIAGPLCANLGAPSTDRVVLSGYVGQPGGSNGTGGSACYCTNQDNVWTCYYGIANVTVQCCNIE